MKNYNKAYPIAPFLRSGNDAYDMMNTVYKALWVLCFFSVFLFGYSVVIIVGTAFLTGNIIVTLSRFFNRRFYFTSNTWKISILLFSLSLPPSVPWYVVVISTCIILLLNQILFAIGNANIFNPALIGRASAMILFPYELYKQWPTTIPQLFPYIHNKNLAENNATSMFESLWDTANVIAGFDTFRYPDGHSHFIVSSASVNITHMDALSTPTPLYLLQNYNNMVVELSELNIWELLLGFRAGSLGETSILLIFLLGLWLCIKKIIDFRIPLIYLGTLTSLSYIFGGLSLKQGFFYHPVLPYSFTGSAVFVAFFYITDYGTTSVSARGRYLTAFIAGVLVFVFRFLPPHGDPQTIVILLMNFFTALFEIISRQSFFGQKQTIIPKPIIKDEAKDYFIKLSLGCFILLGSYIGAVSISQDDYLARKKQWEHTQTLDLFPQYTIKQKITDQVFLLSDFERNDVYLVYQNGMTHKGYTDIAMIFKETNLCAIEIIKPLSDTKGLGDQIYNLDWEQNLIGLSVDQLYGDPYSISEHGVDLISGATVTSIKIVSIIQSAYNTLQKVLRQYPQEGDQE